MFKKQPVASFIFLMEKKNKKKNKAVHGILFNFIFYCLYVVVIIKKKKKEVLPTQMRAQQSRLQSTRP